MVKKFRGKNLIFPIDYKLRLENAALQFFREMAEEKQVSMNVLLRKALEEFLERELPGFSKKSYETGKLSSVPSQPVQQPQPASAQSEPPWPPLNSRPVLPEERAPDEPQPGPAPVQSQPAQPPPIDFRSIFPKPAQPITPQFIEYLRELPPETTHKLAEVQPIYGDSQRHEASCEYEEIFDESKPIWRRRNRERYVRKIIEDNGWNPYDYFEEGTLIDLSLLHPSEFFKPGAYDPDFDKKRNAALSKPQQPLVPQVPSEAESLTPEIVKYLKGLPPISIIEDMSIFQDPKHMAKVRSDIADQLVSIHQPGIDPRERRALEAHIRDLVEEHGWNMEDYFPPMGWAHFKIPPERQEIADTFESVEPSALADPSLAGLMSSPAEPSPADPSIPGLESQLDPPDWTKSADAQEAFAMLGALAKEQK